MQKKLYLSRTDKKLAGVCGGIAEYLDMDSTIIRLLWVASFFVIGVGIFAYIVAAFIIPHRPVEF